MGFDLLPVVGTFPPEGVGVPPEGDEGGRAEADFLLGLGTETGKLADFGGIPSLLSA